MLYPLECFIGLRYLRSSRRGFVSFITFASVTGVGLGVAALIVILSVMNGLEAELRSRLLSMTAHASLSSQAGLADADNLWPQIEALPGVIGVAPYVALQGMLAAGANLSPALVKGVSAREENAVSAVERFMVSGSLADLEPGSDGIILGRVLALNLGVQPGDRLNLLVPRFENQRIAPRLRSFRVSGIFEAGIQEHDGNLALIALDRASELKGYAGLPEGLAIRLQEPLEIDRLRGELAQWSAEGLRYSDWTIENRTIFRAIRIEKTMMSIILLLIVAVAAFNIVASLVMVVRDKRRDIAILRTYGMTPAQVARLFLFQGALLGLLGIVLGTALGVLLALNVETIVPWLERIGGFQVMPGDVYYLTEIPSEVRVGDVVLIPSLALLMAMLATLLPSRRAAAISPAEALRHD
jgi:lipoprotein-releasing system permease protein